MVVFAADKKASQATFESVGGQRDLKEGLLAVAADDGLDGLLIRGEKGTAKSTTVRALADLLPVQRAVADCPYGCPPGDPARQCSDCRDRENPAVEERAAPLVTLPLGATRDRVVGTLSVADALAGEAEFDPGLLARANRGLLYVDEVNLLDDHLVDVLLDAAASGVNRVERDSVTVSHPAEFTLVGTMNPEEGDLRPQLRDRFALQTEVTACEDLEDRVAIIDQALGDTDEEPREDRHEAAGTGRSAGERLATARELLPDVDLPPAFREQIGELCRDAGLDGHRGDIATARAARTFAALDDRTTVLEPDVERAAEFALPHRLTSEPFAEPPDVEEVLDDHFGDDETEEDGQTEDEGSTEPRDDEQAENGRDPKNSDDGDESGEAGDGGRIPTSHPTATSPNPVDTRTQRAEMGHRPRPTRVTVAVRSVMAKQMQTIPETRAETRTRQLPYSPASRPPASARATVRISRHRRSTPTAPPRAGERTRLAPTAGRRSGPNGPTARGGSTWPRRCERPPSAGVTPSARGTSASPFGLATRGRWWCSPSTPARRCGRRCGRRRAACWNY
jgi:magnesium chelatase subunit D